MITIKNVRRLDDRVTDFTIDSPQEHTIEADQQLLLLPALTDPHICFGLPSKANWESVLQSAIKGGITTVIDLPDQPSIFTEKGIEKAKQEIDQKLASLRIPLDYHLYSSGSFEQMENLGSIKSFISGVALSNAAQLDDAAWDKIFQMAAWQDLSVVINAHNENAQKTPQGEMLLEKAIHYAERQNTRLYVLNLSSQEEIDLIQKGRARALLIYTETTPYHLFSDPSKAKPLWEALSNGTIETIGSGYFGNQQDPIQLSFKGQSFSFSNPMFLLPLLLTASLDGKLSVEKIVELTRLNIRNVFDIEANHDAVLVDLGREEIVQRTGGQATVLKLKGWPVYTIVKGQLIKLSERV
jgi:dihydroorotase